MVLFATVRITKRQSRLEGCTITPNSQFRVPKDTLPALKSLQTLVSCWSHKVCQQQEGTEKAKFNLKVSKHSSFSV